MREIREGDLVTYTAAYVKKFCTETRVGIVVAIRKSAPEAIRYGQLMGRSPIERTQYQISWETPDGGTGDGFARRSNIRIAR